MKIWITEDETEPGRVVLKLNRPGKHNALTGSMVNQLQSQLEALSTRQDLWLLQLEGAGHWFCSGIDLNWMLQMGQADWSENLKDAEALASLLHRLWHFPCPTLCKVEGGAMGGGLGLVACCDLVLATRNSLFTCGEVRLGLIPAVIAPYLLQKMTLNTLLQQVFTGQPFSAQTAQQTGLVSECYQDMNALEQGIRQQTAALRQSAPQVLRQCKQLICQLNPVTPALATGQWLAEIRRSASAREGISAFLEKRQPNWSN